MSMIKEFNEFRKIYGGNLLRIIFTGTDNLLLYLGIIKKSRGPLSVGWDITFKCNARCEFCDVWKMGKQNTKELTTKECLKIIRQIGKAKTWAMSFTGGEPLLRPDIGILIKEAKKQGIKVNINTNGALLKKRAEELINSGVDVITVSLDSHKPELHDSIRRFKGLFKLAEEGIEKVKRKRKGERPLLMARFTINRKNYKEIEPYMEFWKNKVDKITLQPVYEGFGTSFFHIKGKDVEFKEKDKKEFMKYFNKLIKKHKWLNKKYYKEIPNFFFEKEKLRRRYKCFSAYFYLVIDPFGNTFPCGILIKNFGNLREKSLKEVWNNKAINQFRKIIKNKKNNCFCWATDNLMNIYLSRILK